METRVICQCHKARATSCTLLYQPHRPFPSPTHSPRKLAVLLPREIQGCALPVPPSRLQMDQGALPWAWGYFFPSPRAQRFGAGATCKATVVCAPDLSAHACCTGLHVKVHVGVLKVSEIKISYKVLHHGTKPLGNPARTPQTQKWECLQQ